MKHNRKWYIPETAKPLSDPQSSAVVYLYTSSDILRGVSFQGKAQKPEWNYRFRSENECAATVRNFFASVRAREARRIKNRKERTSAERGVEVGDILRTSWGYEQTNVEYFQVTALVGKKMVEVREISQSREETNWAQGKCAPMVDKFIGEPLRKIARNGAVKIDDVRTAWLVKPESDIAGVKTYSASHWSAYH